VAVQGLAKLQAIGAGVGVVVAIGRDDAQHEVVADVMATACEVVEGRALERIVERPVVVKAPRSTSS